MGEERLVPKYSLNLFGGFDLRDEQGAAVTLRSKKGRCLLAYLALAPGQHKPRDELAALLWGDRGNTQARRSLSQELYRLRGLFPEDIQDGFVLEAESVGLEAGLFEVDVANFERGLDSGDAEAAALYTGELLAGQEANQEGFDEWLRGERERLRERAIAGLHEIMRAHLEAAPENAANAANSVLALDAASEAAHRALMQLHANAGRRDLALRQYDKCREVLARELGIEPDGTTQALYEKVKSDAPATQPDTDKVRHDDALPLPSKPSIAVLPFENMSGDPEQAHFADGIAEDLTTALARSRWLLVIARNSSFAFRGRALDVKEIGRELGARYVLEGSVRKTGKRVRITAQLIETSGGAHLWAERYDRDLEDIFAIQDEITETIVAQIEPELVASEGERARRKHPDSLDAWECYHRGLWYLHENTPDDINVARRLFGQAVELDPSFGPAYAAQVLILFYDSNLGYGEISPDRAAHALAAAQKAVSLDDKDPFAHAAMGWAYAMAGDYDATIDELQISIDLNPSYAFAHYGLGSFLARAGRPEEAVECLDRAIRFVPAPLGRIVRCHRTV